ncbi:hypothetical protein LEP1GSC042_1906 [Leptospira kirschneri serovar Bim str. PUO 1247]|nr:hypothetical protein LEP1GSC042_1906 [Leptospira kirschneri serovar Bim str. PUO 1247]
MWELLRFHKNPSFIFSIFFCSTKIDLRIQKREGPPGTLLKIGDFFRTQ